MMTKPAQAINEEFRYYARTVAMSGRDLDDRCIEAGFFSIKGERDYVEGMLRTSDYYRFLEDAGTDGGVEKARRDHDHWFAEIERRRSKGELDDALEEALNSQELDPHEKYYLMSRFSREFLKRTSRAFIDDFLAHLEREQRTVCSLFPPPGEDYSPRSSKARRKHVYHTVSDEIFGRHGFVRSLKTGGFHSYRKRATDTVDIVISVDHTAFGKDYPRAFSNGTEYWFNIPLDISIGFHDSSSAEHSDVYLNSGTTAIAERRMKKFEDSSSLESSIRLFGLWYELVFLPFEKSLNF